MRVNTKCNWLRHRLWVLCLCLNDTVQTLHAIIDYDIGFRLFCLCLNGTTFAATQTTLTVLRPAQIKPNHWNRDGTFSVCLFFYPGRTRLLFMFVLAPMLWWSHSLSQILLRVLTAWAVNAISADRTFCSTSQPSVSPHGGQMRCRCDFGRQNLLFHQSTLCFTTWCSDEL